MQDLNPYMETPEEMIKLLFEIEYLDMSSFNKSCSTSIFDLKHTTCIYCFAPNQVHLSVSITSPIHVCSGDQITCDCHWDAWRDSPDLNFSFTKKEVGLILATATQLKLAV